MDLTPNFTEVVKEGLISGLELEPYADGGLFQWWPLLCDNGLYKLGQKPGSLPVVRTDIYQFMGKR